MDNKELLKEVKRWQADYLADMAGYLSSEDKEKVNNALKEIVGLISAHSEEAEVGDEERKELDKHFINLTDPTHWSICVPCQQIRAILRQRRTVSREHPKIICLCGSTRFTEQMLIKQWELTKQGYIVLSWCALPDSYFAGEDKNHIGDQEGVKTIVDEVHKRKIDLADEVFVINTGGYIGESTRSEIEYAQVHRKKINYLERLAELGIAIEEPKGGGEEEK